MLRRTFLLITLWVWWPASGVAETPAPHWILVTAPAFRDALAPLCEHRKNQGLRVEVVQTTDLLSAKEIAQGESRKLREHVNRLCREHKGTTYVLLVGALEAGKAANPDKIVLPPLTGTISRMKGEPTDNGFGCPGEDRLPSVAVGRFPARTEQEARDMVKKTFAFERDRQPGEWRRRVTLLGGAPAFNAAVDAVAEKVAMARFVGRLDPTWTGRAIYHNPQSAFCLPDDRIHDRARALVEEGQAITIYLGHSNAEGFWAGRRRYLHRDDWANMEIARGPGIFATFGCNGCQLKSREGPDDLGYGVAAMRNPHGPVAVIGSHGICFAAMANLACTGLFDRFFAPQPPERLGDCWLRVKTALAKEEIDPFTFWVLDKVDGDPTIPQATQRQEHLEMFILLGDPALKLPAMANDVQVEEIASAKPGEKLAVRGNLPKRLAGARVHLTLERPLHSLASDLQPLPAAAGPERDRVMVENYERANRFVLATKDVKAAEGRLETSLELPDKFPWPRAIIRVYAATDKQEGLGVRVVPVSR